MKKAEQILGRRLKKTEVVLFNLMESDRRYEMYKNDNGDLAFRLKQIYQ